MTDTIHLVCSNCLSINRLERAKLSKQPKCGKCKNHIFQGLPIEADQSNFDKYVKSNDIPLLIDFWAPWCGPCRMMAPNFEAAAKILEPQIRLIKINTENEQHIASRYTIQSIPTLLLIHKGREIARSAGAMGTQDIVRWTKQFL
jgi:thioredoxin 2